jgi:hypothetical protein
MTIAATHDFEHLPRLQQLIDKATRVVSVPRADPADSFVLHAPLNVMARIGLLDYVEPEARPDAEAAIETVVGRYESAGPAVTPPTNPRIDNPDQAARRLAAAMRAGDLDDVDALATALTARLSSAALGHLLGETVIDSLAAAGHAPIGFHLLQRVHRGRLHPSLLRGPLREISRHPDWRIHWFREPQHPHEAAPLETAIGSLPHLGRPGSDFIFPLMSQLEPGDVAARALGPALHEQPDVAHTRRVLTRAAACNMLYGDPAHAPYGWSHCLTMPQGALSLAGHGVAPRTAVAMAVTFFAGFRVAYATETLGSLADDAAFEYAPTDTSIPNETALATFAALHEDEHLAKYTLACFHAATDDPAWRPVYLRAATYLADWWRTNPAAELS